MAKEKKAESVKPMANEMIVEEHEDFVTRKLKAINKMEKPAQAEKLAHRLLRKARNN